MTAGVAQLRAMVPAAVELPAEYTVASISVALAVMDCGRVYAPGLDELKAALARGSTDVVRTYCAMWTRWLARAEKEHAEAQQEAAP